jgi:hypothetical protein
MKSIAILAFAALSAFAQPSYDLLIKGGRVIDAKNRINDVMDVALRSAD